MTSEVASRSLRTERRAAMTGGIIVWMVLPIFQLVEQFQ